MRQKLFKIIFLLVLLAGLFYLYAFSPVKELLTIDQVEKTVMSFGMYAAPAFVLIYIVALLLLVPATLFSIAGGILFGLLWGTILVVIAATIAAGIAFHIARKVKGKEKSAFTNKTIEKIVDKCESQCQEHGIQTFAILRFLYLPYMPLSYAAGLVRTAKFRDFIIATFFTNIIGSFVFVYFGSQIKNGLTALIIPVVLIGLTLSIPRIVKYFRKDLS